MYTFEINNRHGLHLSIKQCRVEATLLTGIALFLTGIDFREAEVVI